MNETRWPEGDTEHAQAYRPMDEDCDDASVIKQHGANEPSRRGDFFAESR